MTRGGALLVTCCACVCSLNAAMLVLVNRVWVHEAPAPRDADSLELAEHRYVAGDAVDVSCVRTTGACHLTVYCAHLNQRLPHKERSVGVRSTLQAEHDRSYVLCQCRCERHRATVNITFILQRNLTDTLELKLNGLTWRKQHSQNKQNIVYYYRRNVPQTFVSDIDTRHFECSFTHYNVNNGYYAFKRSPKFEFLPIYSGQSFSKYIVYYKELDKSTQTTKDEIYITLMELPDDLYEGTPLDVSAGERRDVTTLYEYGGDKLAVCEYSPGERRTLSCATITSAAHNGYGYYVQFGDMWGVNSTAQHRTVQHRTVQHRTVQHRTVQHRTVQLSSAHNNTTLTCSLWYYFYKTGVTWPVRQVNVLFLLRERRNISNDTAALAPQGAAGWWAPWRVATLGAATLGAASVAGTALGCRVWRRRRRRKLQLRQVQGAPPHDDSLAPTQSHCDASAAATVELHYADLDLCHYVISGHAPRAAEPPSAAEPPYAEVLPGPRPAPTI